MSQPDDTDKIIKDLEERIKDREERIKNASILLADWDGYYNPETRTGNTIELADTCFWTDLDDLVVMDVLHDMYKEETK